MRRIIEPAKASIPEFAKLQMITAGSEAPMGIRNIGRKTVGEVRAEIKRGARFVVYEYVISLLVVTRRRASPVYYVEPGRSPAHFHWPYSLLTLALGWWGFPWGPSLPFLVGCGQDRLEHFSR